MAANVQKLQTIAGMLKVIGYIYGSISPSEDQEEMVEKATIADKDTFPLIYRAHMIKN